MTELDYEEHYEPAVPVDSHGLTMDGKPALIVLVDEYNQLVTRVNEAEGRLAAAELLVTDARSRGEAELDTDEVAEALVLGKDDEREPDVDGAGRTYAEYHPLRRMADEAQQPASTAPFAAGLPLVQGRCPACNGASLFLGDGGYVTCSRIDCPEPDAASTVLEQPADEAQQPEAQAGCSQCGHRACMGRGRRCGVVMTSEAGIVRPPCQCLGAAVSQPGKEG